MSVEVVIAVMVALVGFINTGIYQRLGEIKILLLHHEKRLDAAEGEIGILKTAQRSKL